MPTTGQNRIFSKTARKYEIRFPDLDERETHCLEMKNPAEAGFQIFMHSDGQSGVFQLAEDTFFSQVQED